MWIRTRLKRRSWEKLDYSGQARSLITLWSPWSTTALNRPDAHGQVAVSWSINGSGLRGVICKLFNHWRSLKWSRANSWLAVARLTPLKKKVYLQQQFPTSPRHWPIIVIKLGQRLRRWPNVITTIIQCLVFVVKTVDPAPQQCLQCLPRVQTRTTQWLVLQF